jgi:hypothetical protein
MLVRAALQVNPMAWLSALGYQLSARRIGLFDFTVYLLIGHQAPWIRRLGQMTNCRDSLKMLEAIYTRDPT